MKKQQPKPPPRKPVIKPTYKRKPRTTRSTGPIAPGHSNYG